MFFNLMKIEINNFLFIFYLNFCFINLINILFYIFDVVIFLHKFGLTLKVSPPKLCNFFVKEIEPNIFILLYHLKRITAPLGKPA